MHGVDRFGLDWLLFSCLLILGTRWANLVREVKETFLALQTRSFSTWRDICVVGLLPGFVAQVHAFHRPDQEVRVSSLLAVSIGISSDGEMKLFLEEMSRRDIQKWIVLSVNDLQALRFRDTDDLGRLHERVPSTSMLLDLDRRYYVSDCEARIEQIFSHYARVIRMQNGAFCRPGYLDVILVPLSFVLKFIYLFIAQLSNFLCCIQVALLAPLSFKMRQIWLHLRIEKFIKMLIAPMNRSEARWGKETKLWRITHAKLCFVNLRVLVDINVWVIQEHAFILCKCSVFFLHRYVNVGVLIGLFRCTLRRWHNHTKIVEPAKSLTFSVAAVHSGSVIVFNILLDLDRAFHDLNLVLSSLLSNGIGWSLVLISSCTTFGSHYSFFLTTDCKSKIKLLFRLRNTIKS